MCIVSFTYGEAYIPIATIERIVDMNNIYYHTTTTSTGTAAIALDQDESLLLFTASQSCLVTIFKSIADASTIGKHLRPLRILLLLLNLSL